MSRKDVLKHYYEKLKADPERWEKAKARRREYYHRSCKTNPVWVKQHNARLRQHYYKRIASVEGADRHRQVSFAQTQKSRERHLEIKKRLQQYLGGKCVHCGITDYRVLDFDHIDPLTKKMLISQNWGKPWEVLIEEADKCQLLCANCHRIKNLEDRAYNSYIRKTREFRNPRRTKFKPPTEEPKP